MLPGFSFPEHEVEKNISKYRPDILSKLHGSYFAWEIFVSHEIEEAKAEAFKKQLVPFIEIVPTLKGSSEYYFALHSFGGFDLVDTQRAFFPLLFESYRDQLLAIYNSRLNAETRIDMRNRVESNIAEISRISAWNDFRGMLSPRYGNKAVEIEFEDKNVAMLLGKEFSIDIWADGFKNEPNQGIVPFGKAVVEKNLSIKINQKFFVSSQIRLFSGIVKRLSELKYLKGIINNVKQLVGIELEFPTVKMNEKARTKIILGNEAFLEEGILISYIKGCRSRNNQPYCMALTLDGEEFYVKNHSRILVEMLNFFGNAAKVSTYIQNNEKGYPTVVGLRLSGVPDRKKMIAMFSEFFYSVVNRLFPGGI